MVLPLAAVAARTVAAHIVEAVVEAIPAEAVAEVTMAEEAAAVVAEEVVPDADKREQVAGRSPVFLCASRNIRE